jgi:ribonucleoside-diphosphate reductase alpha chain
MAEPSGPKIDNMYKLAWVRGLKTTYYLRAASKTRIEKTTMNKHDGKLRGVSADPSAAAGPKACSIDDPECEACQ